MTTAGTTSHSHEVYQAGKELCVVLKGRVVLEELEAVKQSVLPRITREIDHVFVDLKNVDYVDSAGLGLLIGFKMTSKMQGAGITLMDPNKTVTDVLNISKIDGIFEFLTGRDAQAVRDRLISSDSYKAPEGSAESGAEGVGIPQISADGTFISEDAGAQTREAVEEHCRRAVEFMRQGNYESSIECYKNALELDADYLPALNNLAIVYEKQPGWHSLAVDNWKRVLEISRQRNDEKHMDRAERHLADLTK